MKQTGISENGINPSVTHSSTNYEDEVHSMQMNDTHNEFNHIIKTARWDLSFHCNLNCLHCCAEGLFNCKNYSYGDVSSAIDLLDTLWQNDITHLNLLGREPFLHPHINTILQYACKRGFIVDITTNGTMIKESDISFLVSLGLNCIYFSFDGSTPEVNDTIRGDGVFDKALTTMQKFLLEKDKQKSSLQINVNTTLTKINASDILNIAELCLHNKVNLFKLSHLEPIGNASRNLNLLYLNPEEEFKIAEDVMKQIPHYSKLKFDILSSKPKILEYFYKKYKAVFPVGISGCKACIKEIYIDPAGDISPCLSTSTGYSNILNGDYKHFELNLFKLEGKPIDKHPFYEEFRSTYPLIKDTYENFIPCNSCPYLTTICYPCPLGSLNDVNMEELCLIAEKKLNEINKGMVS